MKVDWLFLDLNSYFASCEQQDQPTLRGKPVAVVPMMADTTCCLAASYEAKWLGIKTGTLVRDAKRLCPQIIFLPANHERYVRYHHKILKAIERVTPIHKVWSIDEVACELMGSEKNPALAEKLSYRIKNSIYQNAGEYLHCSIGLSSNFLLAKVAADMKKPNGFTLLPKESLPHSLHCLQLRDFPGIGASMERRLHSHGIFSVDTLCSLPKEKMKHIWGGIVGERFYELLRGENIELPATRTRSIGHQHVLAPEWRTHQGAIAYLKRLTFKAAIRLRKNEFFTRRIGIDIKYLNHQPSFWREISIEETQSTLTLLKIVDKISKILPPHKPLRVGVVLSDFIPAKNHQLSLFNEEKGNELSYALDHIYEKFGRNAVYFGGVAPLTETQTKIAFSRIPEDYEL